MLYSSSNKQWLKKTISTSTVRQPSDSLTVDLSRVFNLAQSGCHLTYYKSQSTTTHTQLFCLQRVSLDNKLHIHFTSEADRETGFFFSLFFLPALCESQFTGEFLCQCNSNCLPPRFMYRS